jgi:4-amino-4-deoxy-L-arabinose transferase-like glycosyltransferase
VLAAILTLQAALSLRNTNTAFMDEALYLYSGHLELGHLVHGAPLYDDFSTYFSGAPVLYPVLGALADQLGGVFAARLLSLLFMLGATGLLYLTARRIFGMRAGLLAAGLFSTTESVAFVGGLATYDAPAIFLLALAGWIVVRFAKSPWPFYLLAVVPLALAVGTKYAALLFVPTVLALACFGALTTHGRWWSLLRPMSLGLMLSAMIYGLVKLAGADYWTGISSTTTARASGTTPTSHILNEVAQWGGLMFALAALGGVLYVWRPRFAYDAADQPGRAGRLGLVIVLLGTALLAPVDQLHLHTDVSLYKHVGFGLLFAAPLAGYGMQRLIGAHYQRIQLGIAVWVIALALSVTQTTNLFQAWPSSTKLVATIRHYSQPRGEYLVENSAPVIYSLRDDVNAEPYQIISTFTWQFTDLEGRSFTGAAAYTAAIRDDFFNVVAFDYSATAGVDGQILTALKANHDYYLTTTITQQTSQGYDTYFVWVKWEPGQK